MRHMNLAEVIEQYYQKNTKAYDILISHGELVADKALAIARRVGHLNPDVQFIEEASRLHDIGMFLTRAPQLGCHGQHPYICHGYLGRELLEVNPNPGWCWDGKMNIMAGFEGLRYADILRMILEAAQERIAADSLA